MNFDAKILRCAIGINTGQAPGSFEGDEKIKSRCSASRDDYVSYHGNLRYPPSKATPPGNKALLRDY